jgi:hypothetical protein
MARAAAIDVDWTVRGIDRKTFGGAVLQTAGSNTGLSPIVAVSAISNRIEYKNPVLWIGRYRPQNQ